MGGPHTSPEMKKLIVQTWKAEVKKDPKITNKEVRNKVIQIVRSERNTAVGVPGIRVFDMIIKEARESYANRSEEEKRLDDPWSMGAIDDFEPPPDAIPAVIQVWRYALATGHIFTIRQTKWVTRLYTSIPHTSKLWFWSYWYAQAEEIGKSPEDGFDSYVLDANLSMKDSRWEFRTADYTRPTSFPRMGSPFRPSMPLAPDGSVQEELAHGMIDLDIWGDELFFNERNMKLQDLMMDLPTLDQLNMSDESKMVYLHWFTYLRHGPNWEGLSAEEVVDIINRLRSWIQKTENHILDMKKLPNVIDLSEFMEEKDSYKPIQSLFCDLGRYPIPNELLNAVGY